MNLLARGATLAAMTLFASLVARAQTSPVSVSDAWVRWLPNDLPAAGYATLENSGDHPVHLVGASSPDYGMVMLHRSISVDGVEKMVKVDGVDVDPDKPFLLAPGGYHLMLMHAKHPIAPGDTVTIRFQFRGGAAVETKADVQPASATGED